MQVFFMNQKAGFTLVEILVVVLVIGVLVAWAMPSYEKAVAEARSAQLQSSLSSAVKASETYYMATGRWPSSFNSLTFDSNLTTLPGSASTCDKNLLPKSVKRGKDYELVIYNASGNLQHNFISAHFIDGKYKCAGFVHYNYLGNGWQSAEADLKGKTFCAEYLYNRNCSGYNCKNFCEQVMSKTFKRYVQLINLFE